jgi:hypothetical protein
LIKTRIDLVSLSFSNEIYKNNLFHFNVIKQLQSLVSVQRHGQHDVCDVDADDCRYFPISGQFIPDTRNHQQGKMHKMSIKQFNNTVTHECAQRMSELQRYLVMTDIFLIMKLVN